MEIYISEKIGEKTQATVMNELVNRDVVVSIPWGDNQRYDLIIEILGSLYRVQVKTARFLKGTVEFATASSYSHRGGTRKGYKGQADLFMCYCKETGTVYVVPVDEVGESAVRLRVNEPKNNQTKNVRFAKNYTLDLFLQSMMKKAV